MTDVPAPTMDIDRAISDLADRCLEAESFGLQLLNLVGGQSDGLIAKLPAGARARLETVTERALFTAMDAATLSRLRLPDASQRTNNTISALMGAAGGLGGLPTALAEIPVTIAMLMRAIQGVAADYGFDPETDALKADCVSVFAAAGPLAHDDGSELGFLAARTALTGPAVTALVSRVVPRLAAALGPKLAAQAVPLVGAATGATINAIYAQYYQEMAHVRFGLKKLAMDHNIPEDELLQKLRVKLMPVPLKRA